MNIGRLFITRPVMTTLVMIAITLFGLIGYFQLPISNLPNVDFPTLQVTAGLPGASAETMASAVSIPLEKQFATISGLSEMTSSSTMGQSQITLQFENSRNMDGASLDVQAAITAASKQLPTQMPQPPTFAKVNPAAQPIIYLAVSSPTLPLHETDYYAETILAQRISRIAGVAQVQINGSQQFAVRVQVDPRRLSSYGLGINDVATAVNDANQNQPTGTMWGRSQAYTIKSDGQLLSAQAYSPIVIATKSGVPIRLNQVANVIDSVQNDKLEGTYNGQPAIILAVLRQPGANTIQLVNSIKALMPQLSAMLPKSVKVDVLYDQSQSIRESVDDVQFTLVLTVILVVLVIFVFLGSLSATIIPSLALPVSIIGTFAVMKMLGFSLNNLTLMALSLSVGFVVDDAIVMLENIVRHMEMGKTSMQAALDGAKEIGFTIISMTISLVAVFIPVLFLPGVVGKLFNEFAVTISAAILISGVIALSFSPMLCSRLLKHKPGAPGSDGYGDKGPVKRSLSDQFFDKLSDAYRWSLDLALSHKPVVMMVFAGMLIGTGILFTIIPKGFMPEEDTSQIVAMTSAGKGASFEAMHKAHAKLVDIVLKDPNVQSVMSSIGVGNGSPNMTLNQGRLLIVLKSRKQRKLKVDEVITELNAKLANIRDINAYLQNPPTITIGGRQTKSLYQYTLSSPDMKVLYKTAGEVKERISKLPGLIDIASDLEVDNPEVHVKIDRDRMAMLGLSMQQVEDALNSAYSARQISTMYTSTNQNWVIIEVEPRYYRGPRALNSLYLRTTAGVLIPLDTIATMDLSTGPLLVNHQGQFPSVTLSFNLAPGASLGDAVDAIGKVAKEVVPASVSVGFQGTAQAFEESFGNMWVLLLLAVVVIYMVLGILYESFIHPITILSGLPSAGLGALLTLLITNRALDVYGILGLIMLIGIVKKNAIMMIDFAVETERAGNLTAEKSIYLACMTRFRPIMMTTLAALMGAVPIAIGFGPGAESRQPLGLTIVGGLLVSQLVTLYITPVFYIYLDRFAGRKHQDVPAAIEVPGGV